MSGILGSDSLRGFLDEESCDFGGFELCGSVLQNRWLPVVTVAVVGLLGSQMIVHAKASTSAPGLENGCLLDKEERKMKSKDSLATSLHPS